MVKYVKLFQNLEYNVNIIIKLIYVKEVHQWIIVIHHL